MRVYIKTYGCQMNERDSENLAAQLEARGHEIVLKESDADAYVVNTCSVREQAEARAIGKLQRVGYAKKNGFPIIGVFGCMAQNRGESLIRELPKLDFIAGSRKTPYVADYIERVHAMRTRGEIPKDPPRGCRNKWKYADTFVDISDDDMSHNLINMHRARGVKACAQISIMQGCSMKCSYCIVPTTRGQERSRPAADIVREAEFLAANGAKEILLLGQVANAFGRGSLPRKNGTSPFVRLLEEIEKVEGIERIRFTSPHPSFFGDDLIAAYGRLGKLCEYAHLPLQSGSDRILRQMRRPYKTARFLEIAEKLRSQKPLFSISTDIIVGYPGETEEDFQETCRVFKAANFDMAYIFKYSPRAGTPSAGLEDDVPEEEKERRNRELLEILRVQSLEFNERLVGSVQEILVEAPAKRGAGMVMGRTRTHRKVIFKGPDSLVGKLAEVRIDEAGVSAMTGTLQDR